MKCEWMKKNPKIQSIRMLQKCFNLKFYLVCCSLTEICFIENRKKNVGKNDKWHFSLERIWQKLQDIVVFIR